MDNIDLQNMIEKYKEELLKYAKDNDVYVNDDVLSKMPEAKPTVSVVSEPSVNEPEADITELEGTNPDNFNAGRIEPTYENVDDFREKNRGKGYLKVQAFSGKEAFPIVNARVIVSKNFNSSSHTFYDELTDTSGIVDDLELNTPQKDLATQDNKALPFSTYTVRVTHPYFITTVYTNVPMFDGITSIQPVNMIPRTGTPMDDNEIVYVEQEPTDL